MTTVQYRVVVGKKDEIVSGADNAELVITVPIDALHVDPAVSFMQGKLKSVGSTASLFQLMASGAMAAALAELQPSS